MASKMTLYRLVVLGDGGVGKTALTIQLCLNHFVETYDPTIEDSYRKQVVIDKKSCMLEVLDTAGQEEYTALRDQWIRDGEAFILVYSITSRDSFQRIHKFYNQVQRVKESSHANSLTGGNYLAAQMNSSPYAGPVPIMLVGNKSDQSNERQVSTQEGQALAKDLGCDFVEASAKKCINVERAFFDVVRSLRRPKPISGPRVRDHRPDHGTHSDSRPAGPLACLRLAKKFLNFTISSEKPMKDSSKEGTGAPLPLQGLTAPPATDSNYPTNQKQPNWKQLWMRFKRFCCVGR